MTKVDHSPELRTQDPRRTPHVLPNLLGIGAAKSGTTWLASALGAHPDVYMPLQKELNVLHYADLDTRLDEYQSYFREANSKRVRCDFSVRYLASSRAPAAAARLIPAAKLLVVLRNPVDQIQSHYWHLLRQNFHQSEPVRPVPDLFEALERYPQLLFEPALYGKHLQRWLEYFPRERLLVIDYAEFLRAQEPMLDRICDFLQVRRYNFSPAVNSVSASGRRGGVEPRGAVSAWLFPSIYVAAAHGPYMWLKWTAGVRRAETIKRTLRLRQLSEVVFFKQGYRKLDTRDRRKLYDRLRGDIELLASLGLLDTASWREAA